MSSEDPLNEATRRRTFAIISHPDAGKTTLTEKFLLYGGALGTEAGSVKGKRGGRAATSDWMEMEQQRGISITSTVLQFPYRDHIVNLLDTPGHKDFSEDTYRVLAAADAAIMVLDGAKGIEPQTLKLFEVCRDREIPILSFINKWDRPSLQPFEILDDIEKQLSLTPTPLSWPVGSAEDFRGVLDQRSGDFVRFSRTARGATIAPEEVVEPEQAIAEEGQLYEDAVDELGILEAVGAEYDEETFLAGVTTPVFFGSALTNFGVRLLLDAVVDLTPPPRAKTDTSGEERPLDAPFSGFVFKVQANMDKAHRDRTAFFRVCSGKFERGMVVTHEATGKPLATKYAHTAFGTDAKRSTRRGQATLLGWSTPTRSVSATRSGSTTKSSIRLSPRSLPCISRSLERRTRAASNSSETASPSSTKKAWSRFFETKTSAIKPPFSPRLGRCSSKWLRTDSKTSSAHRSNYR